MKTGKALLGVLAALAAGAVLGLIFASDKESAAIKNNRQLADKLNKHIDKKFDELARQLPGKVSLRGNDSYFAKKTEVKE